MQSTFHYQGLFFVLTAPGITSGFDNGNSDTYIRDQLAADHSVWSICGWHKNMKQMQVGGKEDEAGWPVYEEARKGGAIIATAHEHSYSRTHLLWLFREDPMIDVWPSLCSMPISGTTAPLFPSGLLAQALSENYAAVIVAHGIGLIGDGVPPVLRVDYADPRHLTVAYSLPDNLMIQVLLNDLAEYFTGQRRSGIYLHTNSKSVDGFAAADRMAYMLFLGLAGFRGFGGSQLSGDEVFSPVQFVIDMEIGRYVQRVLDGLSWHDDADSLARIVAEGIADGNFLTHPTTVEHVRALFDSPLFRRDSVAQWQSAGKPSVEELAREKARAAIASYHFELEADKQTALDHVFEDACRSLGVDLSSEPIPRERSR